MNAAGINLVSSISGPGGYLKTMFHDCFNLVITR
jgi:hypothetical protein